MFRLKRTIGGLLSILAMVAAGRLLLQGFDCLLNPWACAIFGAPRITGLWSGELITGGGQRLQLFFDVERDKQELFNPSDGCCSPTIIGWALLCGGSAQPQKLELWGRTDDWLGSRFHLQLRAQGAQQGGLSLNVLATSHEGDSLNATGSIFRQTAKNDVSSGADLDGDRFRAVLHRAPSDAPAGAQCEAQSRSGAAGTSASPSMRQAIVQRSLAPISAGERCSA
jgi:hypothetical protein